MLQAFEEAGIVIGDTVHLISNRAEYNCAEIMGIDEHGTVALKHHTSKDISRGKGPWIGGDVSDTLDHVKRDEIVSVIKLTV